MSREKKHTVRLTRPQRETLEQQLKGSLTKRQRDRRQALLLSDEGWTDAAIAQRLGVSVRGVEIWRKRFAQEGWEAAVSEKPRSGRTRTLKANQEAVLVELACSTPPEGRVRWTAQLLANRLVELEVTEEISGETVRRLLKKTNSSRGKSGRGASRK